MTSNRIVFNFIDKFIKSWHMKKISFTILLIVLSVTSFAQERVRDKEEEDTRGFKKENLFTGGGIDFGISTYTTVLGANPVLGYSVAKWLDAGIQFNFDYISQKVYDYYGYLTGEKIRQTVLGPGAFVRAYPVEFLFVQGQFEENFIRYKDIYPGNAGYAITHVTAPSLLLGAGYCQGRESDSKEPFFYLSIMFDV